jgi:hypothetical protein
MYVLTISPILVLATPYPTEGPVQCVGTALGGCIRSNRSDTSYFYRDPIDIVPESLVFSPDVRIAVAAIPSNAQHFEIELPDSLLTLDANNGNWKVRRNARSR